MPKSVQPFSTQKGGQRKANLAEFKVINNNLIVISNYFQESTR